jgi:dihydropteroate synthase
MRRFNARILEYSNAEELKKELEKVKVDWEGLQVMLPKGFFRAVKLEGVNYEAAHILKQEMLRLGGEGAISAAVYFGAASPTDVILIGTLAQLKALINSLRQFPDDTLKAVAQEVEEALKNYQRENLKPMQIGKKTFVWGERTYIMGIINVTPDSFSGDGLAGNVEEAVAQAIRFVEEGADILDIGGESTRPGSQPISEEEELSRVMPVLRRLVKEVDVPISIDTYKARVAREAIEAGASMVNDVWGLRMDPDMAKVVAEYNVPVVVMHNRSHPKNAVQEARLGGRYVGVEYQDLMADIVRELEYSIGLALDAGVDFEKIIVDPGIGFGKTVEQNLEILRRLGELKVLGRPILLGTSRKSVIGYVLNLPPNERVEGTAATVALGIAAGADIVRVHDVKAMARVAKMADAIVRGAFREG